MQHSAIQVALAAFAVMLASVALWVVANGSPPALARASADARAHSRTLTAAYFDSAATSHPRKTGHRREEFRQFASMLGLHSILRR